MDQSQFDRIAKAIADPRRFELLERIAATSELACQDLRECVTISKATLSHHLQELENAGLVTLRREGKFMHLRLDKPVWQAYCEELKNRIG